MFTEGERVTALSLKNAIDAISAEPVVAPATVESKTLTQLVHQVAEQQHNLFIPDGTVIDDRFRRKVHQQDTVALVKSWLCDLFEMMRTAGLRPTTTNSEVKKAKDILAWSNVALVGPKQPVERNLRRLHRPMQIGESSK
ncbi:hypothetical protein K239x_26720 [Planctomycetes bacterium K23_9]|uniref:Uncharacterized protein n=1 Tax=Stieleria marina TaxID=1930275 RepID=A0A517NUB9_9BACT|nr:hypothetical protein K239x_26720 [Planctomycetes bacterium K23_9]